MNSSGGDLELSAEAAADVGGDHPNLALGDPEHGGGEDPHEVRHLRGGPDRDLLTGRVDRDRARLHEGRDQSLLAVLPLDDDAVDPSCGDDIVDVVAGAGIGGVELPVGALVRAQVRVREHLVGERRLEVEHRRELLVVDVDEFGRVARLGSGAGDHDSDDLAGERDPVDGHRRMVGSLLIRRDRPGTGQAALLVGQVCAGQHRDDVRRSLSRAGLDVGDLGVRERAAHQRDVQHAREGEVVGPAGPTGDQALVLLAATITADLGDGGILYGGHLVPPAACSTDLTMLW